jgi:hypothetical protein
MAQSLISQVSQKLAINGIKDIEVTGIVDDGAGGWIRAIRFHGSPAEGVNKVLVLEVLLQSPVKAELSITTPEIDF